MYPEEQEANHRAKAIQGLKKELESIKTDLSERMDTIQAQIRRLEDQLPGQDRTQPSLVETPIPPEQPEAFEGLKAEKPSREQAPVWVSPTREPAASPPVRSAPQKEILKTMGTALVENLLPVFGPATAVLEKLFSVYRHYRSQGKAPVFLMTIAGILTLIMGFGYLFQYSFSQHLGPVGKVVFGFAASAGIVCCGMTVFKKRPDMADFGSSLIGLGVIIAYLCAYFTGPHYDLLSPGGTFVLLAGLTGLAYYLAIVFQTRVVAVISLMGGAFAPVFMAGAAQAPIVYLAYVWGLAVSTLLLSRRIKWPGLAHMAMLVSFFVVEFVILTGADPGMASEMSPGLVCLVHIFFYTFGLYYGWEIVKACGLSRPVAVLSSANLFYFLFVLEQTVPNTQVLGGLYFLNSGLLAALFFFLPAIVKKAGGSGERRRPLQMIVLLCMGFLAGFGILSVTRPEYLGLVWGMEALRFFTWVPNLIFSRSGWNPL